MKKMLLKELAKENGQQKKWLKVTLTWSNIANQLIRLQFVTLILAFGY